MKRWTLREKLTQSHFFSTPEVSLSLLFLSLSLKKAVLEAAIEYAPNNLHSSRKGDPFLLLSSSPSTLYRSGRGMDPHGAMMNEGGGVYSFAEIWPGFQMNANPTSYGLGLDPMVMDQRTNHSPPNHNNTRKRRDEDESGKGGTSTSNSNGNNNNSNGNNTNNNVMNEGDSKRLKGAGSNENRENKVEGEGNSGKEGEQPAKPAEPPKQDYIHVRARRGQATDSHSLAERARREKISERMKILQDLVPGCNKVIGKALVLDEIINYIQSLQRQVEFLSMKLEAVNARVGADGYPTKDFAQQTFEAPGMAFGSQGTREYVRGSSPEWLHMQIGGGFERTS